MNHADDELQTFKTAINLVEYAASIGYALDSKKSCKTSAVMVRPDGDKVVIARRLNNHWTYFSVGDSTDNGTIVDFCQKRTGGNLGHVRKALREFLGTSPLPNHLPSIPELKPVARDVLAIRARFEAMQTIDGHHRYLVDERRIPTALLNSARFAGTVRVDARGSAIFPHTDDDGALTGWELKNSDKFSGFASGGTKSLYRSVFDINDQRLVIAESAIDALSYAALFPCDRTRYVSIAGRMNPDQPALLTSIIQNMRDDREIVAAFDNDEPGHELGEQIESLCLAAGCPLSDFRFHCPRTPGKDFNDVLRQRAAKEQHLGLGR